MQPSSQLTQAEDSFGNTNHYFDLHYSHDELVISAHSKVEPSKATLLPDSLGISAWKEIHSWRDSFDLWDYTHTSELTQSSGKLEEFVNQHQIKPGNDPLRSVHFLMRKLNEVLDYVPQSTTATSTIDHILKTGQGVCQDYSHVMIAIARSWGIPTRYVSGYVYDISTVGSNAMSSATHAWVECLFPGLNWVGFDPVNNSVVDENHILIAVGRDYRDVAPTRGVLRGGGKTVLDVDVVIRARKSDDDTSRFMPGSRPMRFS